MTQTGVQRKPRSQWVPRLAGLAAILVLTYFFGICLAIVRTANRPELHAADAVVVFGAAEYYGRPSPVLRARLDHAYDLFQRGLAPVVITTGGAGDDPQFSEGGVGHDYLMRRGIPDSKLIAETQGSDTAQSAERVAVIMQANGMHSCVAVSDAYHVFRIRQLLQHEGVKVYTAPRPDSRPRSLRQRFVAVTREALSYVFWRLHLPE
ncbi:MAG TPA: YdcF family protein [Terriglobales bacterium]|nr:YdcF family protein [Terriglobales bacterium]